MIIKYGDSLKILPTLEPNSFDCCITDPPYSCAFVGKYYELLKKYQSKARLNKDREHNNWGWGGIPGAWSDQFYKTNAEFEDFTYSWMNSLFPLLKDGSFFLCFGVSKLINININIAIKSGFTLKDILIWQYKPNFSKGWSKFKITGNDADKDIRTTVASSYEPVMLFQKQLTPNKVHYEKNGTGFIDNKILKSNIITCSKPSKKEKGVNPHYSVKPLKLVDILLEAFKPTSVIDPFMGSGTVGVVCKNKNINYYGIELEEEFYNYARNRCE